MARIARLSVATALALAVATSCDGNQDTAEPAPPAAPPSDTTSSPTEGAEPTSTAPNSTTPVENDVCPRIETAGIGDCVEVDIFDGAIYLGEEIFIATPPVAAYPGRRWERSDLPADWNVEILNQAPEDGNDWIIRAVHAERTGERTLEVIEPQTGDRVGTFIRDETPPEERGIPG